ncbi:MAG: LCP family protein [Patescibacteria group bacterium]
MIDFKKKMEEEEEKRLKKQELNSDNDDIIISRNKRKIITYVIALSIIVVIFSGKILMSSQNATGWFPGSGLLDRIRHFVPSSDKLLKGEETDRINILLLGMGGEGHDGAYLTDTILLSSLKPSTKEVALFSIPRDLTVPVNGYWQKINSINAYAEAKIAGSGSIATSQAISELFDAPVDYYVRVDFDGFINIINEIGGIDVNVENTFDDYTYPIRGREDDPNYYARFEHLHFDQGWQKMDGITALKYARSRHALGPEGNDFARAKRQQIILEAVKEKLLSRQTLLNPVTVAKLISEFNKDISTNLSAWEILKLWNNFKDVDRSKIINKVFSDAPDGLLVSGRGDNGAYILTPRTGNFSEIKEVIKNVFIVNENKPAEIPVIQDNASVIINNGTWITGLAGKVSVELEKYNFKVLKTENAIERNHTASIIYDLSNGAKKDSLATLIKISGATIAYDFPEWLKKYQTGSSTQPDFVLITGTEANKN